ncbi:MULTISPECIES: sulfatase [unclassified Lentimonas]|nr:MULTISPECIES: sulfatase [unclassified Lentimonas]
MSPLFRFIPFVCGLFVLLAQPAAAKPNVLLIVADDLNELLGAWGHPVVQTPHIDQLASEGYRFRRAYAQAAVCGPSRASFLTGRRPHEVGVIDNKARFRDACPDLVTLPQHFRENGYYTATVGKVFHHDQIFDEPSWDTCDPNWRFDEFGATFGASRDVTGGALPWITWRAVEEGTLWDDWVVNTVKVEIKKQQEIEQPFFLAAGLMRPHDPFFAPKEFFDMYPLESIRLPENATRDGLPEAAFGSFDDWMVEIDGIDEQGRKELLRAWYACISYVDSLVGEMVAELKVANLYEDTIIVFMGDHGYHNWEKGWWGKATVWELSSRSPLILKVPGRRGDADVNRVIEFIDLYPSLAELAGLPDPERVSGRSFVPLLEDLQMGDAQWQGLAYTQFKDGLYSLRTERFRYCEWGKGDEIVSALYDHEVDPAERNDISAQPEYAELVEQFHEQLEAQRRMRPAADGR